MLKSKEQETRSVSAPDEVTGDSIPKPKPSVFEQAILSIKILLAAGGVIGGLWLLDGVVSK